MNPYLLSLNVQQHIDAIAKKSKLSRHKRDDIKRELTAFAEDYGRELHFDGKDATEIDALVIAAIGEPEQRGKEFTVANQKFSRIPWIGPLFYDEVMQAGALLFFLQAVGLFVFVFVFIAIGNRLISTLSFNVVETTLFFLWLVYGFCMGIYTRLRLQLFWKSFDAVIASIVPVLVFFLVFVVSRLIASYTESAALRFDSLYYSIIFLILYPTIFCGIAVPYRVVQKFEQKNRR
jgi:hypothetical protein